MLKKCERLNPALNRSQPLLVLAKPNGRQTMLLPQCDHNYDCDEDKGCDDAKRSNFRFDIIQRGCQGHSCMKQNILRKWKLWPKRIIRQTAQFVTIERHAPHRHPPHQTSTIPCEGLVWWMSYFTQWTRCLVWWISGVVDVWLGGCLLYTRCCGFPISDMVWWMSYFAHGVVDVWLVDVFCSGCLCGECWQEKK